MEVPLAGSQQACSDNTLPSLPGLGSAFCTSLCQDSGRMQRRTSGQGLGSKVGPDNWQLFLQLGHTVFLAYHTWHPLQAYLILLHLVEIVFFYRLKRCGNAVSSKSIGTVFPTAFAHFVSVSRFGNSHNISNVFIF